MGPQLSGTRMGLDLRCMQWPPTGLYRNIHAVYAAIKACPEQQPVYETGGCASFLQLMASGRHTRRILGAHHCTMGCSSGLYYYIHTGNSPWPCLDTRTLHDPFLSPAHCSGAPPALFCNSKCLTASCSAFLPRLLITGPIISSYNMSNFGKPA